MLGEGGGFGAGADVDFSGSVRADMKIVSHFGLTFGYSALYLKLSDTVLAANLRGEADAPRPGSGAGPLLLILAAGNGAVGRIS